MNKEEQALYERYKKSSNEELKNITVENGYTPIAENVAQSILNSDRKEYYQEIQEKEKMQLEYEEHIQNKLNAQKDDPLYDDIHQMAGDIRFLKNLIIVLLVLSVISYIILFTVVK